MASEKQPVEATAPMDGDLSPIDRIYSHASSSSSSSTPVTTRPIVPQYVDLEAQGGRRPADRQFSISSAATLKDVYGDLPERERSLRRQETLQELRSVYSRQTESLGELDAPDDASEFRAIDPELITWYVYRDLVITRAVAQSIVD